MWQLLQGKKLVVVGEMMDWLTGVVVFTLEVLMWPRQANGMLHWLPTSEG
jgi:hypothetical protein